MGVHVSFQPLRSLYRSALLGVVLLPGSMVHLGVKSLLGVAFHSPSHSLTNAYVCELGRAFRPNVALLPNLAIAAPTLAYIKFQLTSPLTPHQHGGLPHQTGNDGPLLAHDSKHKQPRPNRELCSKVAHTIAEPGH